MARTPSEILLEKKERLVAKFLKNRAFDFMSGHFQILDEYFQKHFEQSRIGQELCLGKNPFAVIALGGYGRGEQNLHSDVDLLFLFGKQVPAAAEKLIREFVYPLWDIGLDVSPATRSLKECVSLAARDYDILTPILDARFICGVSPLYSDLTERIQKKIVANQPEKIIEWLVQRNKERHLSFGDSSYLLEPNLKEGQGGMRDYHTLLWISRIRSNLKQRRDLEYLGYLSHDEYELLDHALQFVWMVRNRLHHLTGRKCDQLHMEYQKSLAETLNYKKRNGKEPVERFLGDLHGRMAYIKQLHLEYLSEIGFREMAKARPKKKFLPRESGLEIKRDMLNFSSSEQIVKSPDLLVKIFKESARLNVPLSAESKRLIKEFGYLIDHKFCTYAPIVRMFETIIVDSDPDADVLGDMLSTGFLIRFIPEMKGIINRIQYNEYHIYPVDLHLLKTVQTLKRFGAAEDDMAESYPLSIGLYQELKKPKLLFWAGLLHDIGKTGSDGGHSEKGAKIVRKILRQKGFKSKEVETIVFLVKEHLLLVKTAARRDIQDEETAIVCARRIGDKERLKMLYLLSVADSISTGPKAWNDWTSTLLRDLFFKVLGILEKGELATRKAVLSVEKKKESILRAADSNHAKGMIESMFNVMSPRYLLYTASKDILGHMDLYDRLKESDFILEVAETLDSNTRKVTVCAKDKPGLFSKIAGVFTLNGIDILDAQIYTWKNSIALDIFEVKPPPDQLFEDQRWDSIRANLSAALGGHLELGSAIGKKMSPEKSIRPYTTEKPQQVVVDNNSSSFFTIIEVFAYDYPGLLFKITDALYRCKLDIRIAKIATNVDQGVDVFYVRDFEGQKVDLPDQVEGIKGAVMAVLSGH
jgi:[protein-PII] uridylyltransferase